MNSYDKEKSFLDMTGDAFKSKLILYKSDWDMICDNKSLLHQQLKLLCASNYSHGTPFKCTCIYLDNMEVQHIVSELRFKVKLECLRYK